MTSRPSTADPGTRFAAAFAALLAAHHVADYWIQTDHQAVNKGRHGTRAEDAAGRAACLAHVLSYTVTTTAAVAGANRALRLGATWPAILAGQAISAITHYWADRRFTLRRLAARLRKRDFYDRGQGLAAGSAALDQSWHLAWLAVAALATATLSHPVHSPRGARGRSTPRGRSRPPLRHAQSLGPQG